MYLGSLPPVSNKAGWNFVREVVDADTDEDIDLSTCSIVFEVCDDSGQAVLSATTSNGKVTLLVTGVFQVSFTRDEMTRLGPGTYDVGCTVAQSGNEPQQFIIGTLPVLNGVVTQ